MPDNAQLLEQMKAARDEFQRFLQMYDRLMVDVSGVLELCELEDSEKQERREQLLKAWRVIKKVPNA